jgi:hypothetical protein
MLCGTHARLRDMKVTNPFVGARIILYVFVKAVSSTLLLRMSGAGKAARATAPVSISA